VLAAAWQARVLLALLELLALAASQVPPNQSATSNMLATAALSSARRWAGSCFVTFTALCTLLERASAQTLPGCEPEWQSRFGAFPGVDGDVYSMARFDSGAGLALYVGGDFHTAGGVQATRVAKWDGSSWTALGAGVSSTVHALAAFDDGAGKALYAGGKFSTAGGLLVRGVAKWDGAAWTALGAGLSNGASNVVVNALAEFHDGTSSALYVGGEFTHAGGVPVNGIARWRNGAWSALGGGVSGGAYPYVYTLHVHDDGTGPALYVGGEFTLAGWMNAPFLARWRAQGWSAVGAGLNGPVTALATFNAGAGSELMVGGAFTSAGGVAASRVARWRQSTWSAVGAGVDGFVQALLVHDDGTGPALHVGGRFSSAGGAPARALAKWNGSSWSGAAAPLPDSAANWVNALANFPSPTGSRLYVGGRFTLAAPSNAKNFGVAEGASWQSSGSGFNGPIRALETLDWGAGPHLCIGGEFSGANGLSLPLLAVWDGVSLSTLGGGLASGPTGTPLGPRDFAVYDDGAGPALYVAGQFTSAGGTPAANIAKWNGQNWSPLGQGILGVIDAIEVFDDGSGPALYAGGAFGIAGGIVANRVARWDGSSWSPLGSGTSNSVYDLEVFDDGSGPALFAAGVFVLAGGNAANHIAKWDGAQWLPVGAGVSNTAYCMAGFDDGSGPALYVGGDFVQAGGVPAQGVARWNGQHWSAVGGVAPWPLTQVRSFSSFDDGAGPALFAAVSVWLGGGDFRGLVKFDGAQWTLPDSSYASALTLATFDDGRGPALYVGGLSARQPSGDAYLGQWGCPVSSAGVAYCTSGTTSSGCAPSVSAVGAASASAASGFDLRATGVDGQRAGLWFYGASGPALTPWGAGSSSFMCVNSPRQRMAQQFSGGSSGACDGNFAVDWNRFRARHPSGVGQPFAGGEVVCAQAWFRDPPAPKATSLSDALAFVVAP